MEIKDYNFLSFSNNFDKSHYFNNLILQDQEEYRLHYFSDLNGFFRINKLKYPISSGSFFITKTGDHYSISPIKTAGTLGYFVITLRPKRNEKNIHDFIESELIQKSFSINSNKRMTLEEILGKLNSDNPFLKEASRHRLIAFLYNLPEYKKKKVCHSDNHKYIEKAVKYMHERVYQELKLSNLCEHLCISEPHCIRLFKGQMGTTPMKYFTRIKIEESVAMLLTTNKALALIAEELKFSSAAHFSKTFKQYLSISPTQYRSNYINTLEQRQKTSLKEQENAYSLLQNIIDASPDLIFFKDKHGVLMGGNKAFCHIMGCSREQIIGKSDYEVFSKEAADFFQKRDGMIFRDKRPIKNEEVMTYPNGRKRTFEVYKAPFNDDQGKIIGLIGISRDITDRIITRKALEEAQIKQKELSDQQATILSSLSKKLLEVLEVNENTFPESTKALQLRLFTEGLNTFIQKLFSKPIINNKATDPKFLFTKLEFLLKGSLNGNNYQNDKLKIDYQIPSNLPEIVFIDENRILRLLFFLIRTLSLNINTGLLSIRGRFENKLLIIVISLNSPGIPERKYHKIDKLVKREEGFIFLSSKDEPIELSMANMELEILNSKIQIFTSTPDIIEIEVTTPFPSGIEYLNEYYAQK